MNEYTCPHCGEPNYSAAELENHADPKCAKCGGLMVPAAEGTELPACAHCGSETIRIDEQYDTFMCANEYKAVCEGCGCQTMWKTTEAEARAAWSRRTPDIVRCADCRYGTPVPNAMFLPVHCSVHKCFRRKEGFCSSGVRREAAK